jgi:endonuclease/exonuclease/phosphatase family metal-dependent hydrolase
VTRNEHPGGDGSLSIAIRNFGGASYAGNTLRDREHQVRNWDSLLATGADIVLAQEATGVGQPFAPPEGWMASPADRLDRGAGSVVAARSDVAIDLGWRPSHPVLDACASYLDFGNLRLDGDDIATASVHVPTKHRPEIWAAAFTEGGNPPRSGRPWPSDIILDALMESLGGREVILAGDWNEAPNWPTEHDSGTRAWFDRARSFGLVEIISNAFSGPVRTNFTPRATKAYQNDHVFMTSAVAERVRSVAVFNELPLRRLSDHAGLAIVLDG